MSRPLSRLAVEALETRLTPAARLDPFFGTAGRVFADYFQGAPVVAVQTDGKIVLAGFTSGGLGGNDFAVARYNPDGTLDATFDGDGRVAIDFGGSDVANAVAIQPDGKIVVAGSAGGDFGVVRLTAAGALDTSFDDDGRQTISFGGFDLANAVAVRPDGAVVVAGYTSGVTGVDFAVARLTTAGALDATFDGDGRQTIDFGSSDVVNAVALQPDGAIVVVGQTAGAGVNDFGVARLTPAGALDVTFDGDGRQAIDLLNSDIAYAVAVLPGGQLLLAGTTSNGTALGVVRLTAAGALDAAFDADGRRTVTGLGANGGRDAVVLADGKIVLAVGGFGSAVNLVRLLPDGADDPAFGVAGRATVDVEYASFSSGARVALQADGGLLVTAASFRASLVRVVAGPGTDAVAANFGSVLSRWTAAGGWVQLSTTPANELDVADDGAVFGVFADGVRRWDAAGAGVLTTALVPDRLDVAPGGVAYGDFGAAGTWRFDPGAGTWALLTAFDPTTFVAGDDGSLYGQYNSGLWRWSTGSGWQVLTGSTATSLAAADGGVFGVFPNGVWRWKAGTWTGLTGAVPEAWGVSDAGLFHGDFGSDGGPDGLWSWSPADPVWRSPTGADPSRVSVSANGDLYATFASGPFAAAALWKWVPSSRTWSQLTTNPVAVGVGVDGAVFANRGPSQQGLWRYDAVAGWVRLTDAVPTLLTSQR